MVFASFAQADGTASDVSAETSVLRSSVQIASISGPAS